jgi:hypothetical protein
MRKHAPLCDLESPSLESCIDCETPDVKKHQVHFLDVRALITGHGDDMVGVAILEPVLAAQGNCDSAFFLRGLEPTQNILGFAAGGNSDDHIAHHRESFDLPLEESTVSEVVGDTGDDTRVTNQGNGGQWSPCFLEASDQFFDQMVGLGRAASVPERENLSPAAEARDDGIGGSV